MQKISLLQELLLEINPILGSHNQSSIAGYAQPNVFKSSLIFYEIPSIVCRKIDHPFLWTTPFYLVQYEQFHTTR